MYRREASGRRRMPGHDPQLPRASADPARQVVQLSVAPGATAVLDERSIRFLQRTGGNRRVAALVAGQPRRQPVAVQRHSSWEHALMGDVSPKALGKAAGDAEASRANRDHVIGQQWSQIFHFHNDPDFDPRAKFPDITWIQLKGARLWVSYGELNALPDYLPDPGAIDNLPRSVVLPVLQRMRSGISAQLLRLRFKGQAASGGYEAYEPVGEVKALDKATASLGANRYQGLLARNACHFAPYSWHRWAAFHNEAREHAEAYQRLSREPAPVRDLDTSADDNLRQAWLKNGYGDHFLQDSFAAGHLVNKTLVMQWFVEYLDGMASKWWNLLWPSILVPSNTQPWYGMPDDEVMATMGTAQQPGMAGQSLYVKPSSHRTASTDRLLGSEPTDPQSAEERLTPGQRVAGSGVVAAAGRTKEQNYANYLAFLNNTFLQLAGKDVHDYFNKRGLSVSNERGDTLQVGGDDTLLSKSGPVGAEVAAEAAKMSRDTIDETSRKGTSPTTVEDIWKLFPTSVWTYAEGAWTKRSLADWQTEVLHQICIDEIFPDVVTSFSSKVIRALPSQLVEGGVGLAGSPATGMVPPIPTASEMGDWVVPRGMSHLG